MNKVLQFALTAAMGGVAAFFLATTACTPDVPPEEACQADPFTCTTCETAEWCGGKKDRFKWICKIDKSCQKVCQKTSDCRTALKEVCEVGVCRPPGCGSDAECNGGKDQCLGGVCASRIAASAVKSCTLLPAKGLLHEGSGEGYSVVARDADGKSIGYKDAITWAVDKSARASAADGVVTGGSEGGAVEITATIGATSCKATATNFAKTTGNKLRVVVADLLSKELVNGAKVVVEGETKVTADGFVEFDNPPGKPTVSVFDANHAWVTLVDANKKDLVVYLKPPPGSGKFTGEMESHSFDNLSDLKGNIHLMLSGASIPGNLIDIQLSTLLGELVKTKLELSPSQHPEVPLPAGTVIGMGDTMFKPGYSILAPPGVRAIWGLGGNAEFAKITAALGPALGGNTDNLNVGSILSGLLPVVEGLQSGVLQGETSVADTEVDLGGKVTLGADNKPKLDKDGKVIRSAVRLKLNTLLRLRLLAELPALPSYKLDGKDVAFEGAILVAGALQQPQGFIPLGLTAGVDQKGATVDGKAAGNGKIDVVDPTIPEGTLSLRMAPLHDGLETSKYAILALAASFSGIASSDTATDKPEVPLVLSGAVGLPGEVAFPTETPRTFKVADKFLGVPDDPTLDGRSFGLGSKVDGASFHRLDIGDEKTGEWFIYFPAGNDPASFKIPTPPEGMADRLMALENADDVKYPQVILQSISLRTESGLDYDSVLEFDSRDNDDLSSEINAFSARQIIREKVQK